MSKIPDHLKHKPIYVIENYAAIDGHYKNDTDVKGISVGRAQWCTNEFVPSVKMWRKPGERWSRQSEETTLTRALDMATLAVKVLDKHYNQRDMKSIDTVFGSVDIKEQNTDLQAELSEYLDKNEKDISTHIDILYQALKRYKGE